MAANHTPGPWSVDDTVALGAYGVWTRDADPRNPGHDGSGYQVQICSMLPTVRNTPIGKDERGANARLIAAAPSLYQACRNAYICGVTQAVKLELLRALVAVEGDLPPDEPPPPVSGGGPDVVELADRVRPFSNGSQFADWVSSNCDRCTKGTAEQEPHELCDIARGLGEASWGDGTVSADIARRMGYDTDSARYTWPCGEVEWAPEWRAEWAAKHGVASDDDWPRDATAAEKRAEAVEAYRMVSEGGSHGR